MRPRPVSPVRRAGDPVWFLRSMRDADTHRGGYSTVTGWVRADCGVEFVPLQLPWGRGVALPGSPQDLDQACSRCRAAATGGTR